MFSHIFWISLSLIEISGISKFDVSSCSARGTKKLPKKEINAQPNQKVKNKKSKYL
jgi:hypothetical protein